MKKSKPKLRKTTTSHPGPRDKSTVRASFAGTKDARHSPGGKTIGGSGKGGR